MPSRSMLMVCVSIMGAASQRRMAAGMVPPTVLRYGWPHPRLTHGGRSSTLARWMTFERHAHDRGFEHEALLYAGIEEFVDRTAAFVAEGVEAGAPAMVVVGGAKLERLRAAL